MTEELQIREYDNPDEQAVIDLWNDVLPSSQPWNDPRTIIRRKRKQSDGLFFVGELEGKITATVLAGYDGVRGWIYAVAVAPDCRKQNVGRRMIEKAEQVLYSRGCQKINLQVRATSDGVVAFYQKLGFDVEDRISMGKPLSPPAGDTFLDPVPTLAAGDGIVLSQVRTIDKASFLRYLNETEEFRQFMGMMPYPYTEQDAEDWLYKTRLETLEHNRVRNWAIRDDTEELIGGIGLFDMTIGERAEIGYWLAKPFWGRGIVARAVSRVAEFAFSEYRLVKLWARVFEGNLQSERVLQKAGFQKEGTLRRQMFRDGKAMDLYYYGLLREEL